MRRIDRQMYTLEGGSELHFRSGQVPLFVLRLVFEGAEFAEPQGKNGVAALSARMLFEGTRRLSGLELSDELDRLGIEWSLAGTSLQMTVLSSRQAEFAALLTQILSSPRMDPQDFRRARRELYEELGRGLEESEPLAQECLRRHLYQGTSAERHPGGTVWDVQRLEIEDIRQFYEQFMGTLSLKFYVAGCLDCDTFVRDLDSGLRGMHHGSNPIPAPEVEFGAKPRRLFILKDRAQSAVLLGHRGIRRLEPEYRAMRVADAVFGQGSGLTSRLAIRLREELGLCYSVGGDMSGSANRLPGIFQMGLGTADATVDLALRELHSCMQQFVEHGPKESEVRDSVSYLQGVLSFATETSAAVVQLLRRMHVYNGDEDWLNHEYQGLKEIDQTLVHAAVKKFWKPHELSCVVIGRTCPDGFESIDPSVLVGLACKEENV